MHFYRLLVLAAGFLTTATAAPTELIKRDATSVVSAVGDIANQMSTLNSTVSSYRGGFLGTGTALKIEFQSVQLSHALKDAISETEDSAKFTGDESNKVAAAFIDLQPKISSTLDNIVSHKPQFDTGLLGLGSVSFLVKWNLQQEKDLAAELGKAVVDKLAEPYASVAPLLNDQIAAAFEKALAAFA
ncbi:cell wall mannoprotein 1 family protein [Aspergillus alliaceus]|uniref:cell wall mannoprotein 1 family protein n=1 Tax=Petromyces alliaceus TaxID=209559 RepID=UPI0012A5A9BE|nr:hydrophobic surface binding protein A-domain-containing protein [Aspergillus alliaceus]KAB8237142.1 hydrophobic surface binding protein A-domain-containing protein [Aspergillus alliaceus]